MSTKSNIPNDVKAINLWIVQGRMLAEYNDLPWPTTNPSRTFTEDDYKKWEALDARMVSVRRQMSMSFPYQPPKTAAEEAFIPDPTMAPQQIVDMVSLKWKGRMSVAREWIPSVPWLPKPHNHTEMKKKIKPQKRPRRSTVGTVEGDATKKARRISPGGPDNGSLQHLDVASLRQKLKDMQENIGARQEMWEDACKAADFVAERDNAVTTDLRRLTVEYYDAVVEKGKEVRARTDDILRGRR
jgi:hypothetical protein